MAGRAGVSPTGALEPQEAGAKPHDHSEASQPPKKHGSGEDPVAQPEGARREAGHVEEGIERRRQKEEEDSREDRALHEALEGPVDPRAGDDLLSRTTHKVRHRLAEHRACGGGGHDQSRAWRRVGHAQDDRHVGNRYDDGGIGEEGEQKDSRIEQLAKSGVVDRQDEGRGVPDDPGGDDERAKDRSRAGLL